MGTIKFADALKSSELLLEQNNFEQLARVLSLALVRSQNPESWRSVQQLLERIPFETRVEILSVAHLYAKALMFNDALQGLLEFNTKVTRHHGMASAARIQLECAKSLLALQQYSQAKELLEAMLPNVQGELLGMTYGKLGVALFYLGVSWQEAFHQAVQHLSGLELGYVLFNQGTCLDLSNFGLEARATWLKALTLLKADPKMLTLTRYNLGISALRDLEPEAERHFLEAQHLTKNLKTSSVRASILNGLAASRRVLGEWSRAETSYREAIQTAQESLERTDAYFGLARTLRLADRTSEALETLESAMSDETLNHEVIQVSRAGVFLALNLNVAAREALTHVGKLVNTPDQWLEKIARAELARRDGQIQIAVELLEGLPVNTLHAREEAKCFPELMQLLAAAEKPVPKPLEYVKGITVRVVAQGVLSVRVNDRPVNISPTGRTGELLVYLLEQHGAASVEMMTDVLFSSAGTLDADKARRLIWKWVKSLRQAFGWERSVIALRAAYQLDPNVTWEYDINEARATLSFQGEFLKGVYSDWALEVGRSLEGLTSFKRRSSDLN